MNLTKRFQDDKTNWEYVLEDESIVIAQDFACTLHAGEHACKYVTDGAEKCIVHVPAGVNGYETEACQDFIDLPA